MSSLALFLSLDYVKEMTKLTQILDGKKIAQQIKDEVKNTVNLLKIFGTHPALTVIQVGDNLASTTYVKNKIRACEEVGIKSYHVQMKEDVPEEEIIRTIEMYSEISDGVLVQLPLPSHISEERVLQAIPCQKDVDGFHVMNSGKLMNGMGGILPCTPAGIIELLKRSNIEIAGKHCVIIGRSNIVGKPMAMLMLQEDATVTIAHSKTPKNELEKICNTADILIVAVGKPNFINSCYIKYGAVVVDVGINRVDGKLVGDVWFDDVESRTSAITPVPGGVGPMTIAMLLKNCCSNAMRKRGVPDEQ